MAEVSTGTKSEGTSSGGTPGSQIPGERYDPSTEQTISDAELKAWRLAISHKNKGDMTGDEWAEARKNDERESMKQLEELAAQYPRASFIKTMMGQVKHHFGKEKESAQYFEEALAQNRHDPLMTFKCAEARRRTNEHEKAINFYRQTLELQPDFTDARLGLAQALLALDKSSTEAKSIIADVLTKEPDNKVAQSLQSSK